jgi:hypothetical protein
MSKYVSEFLSLQSAPDILGTVGYLGNKPEKEITEAMAIIHKLRPIVLNAHGEFELVDLCSGNALVPVIAAHLLPVNCAVAVDKLPRDRNWDRAEKFTYIQQDIYGIPDFWFRNPTILTAVHCCRDLAEQVVKIYQTHDNIKYLILMPCCIGDLNSSILRFIKEEANGDLAWVTKLAMTLTLLGNNKVSVHKDNFVLSPKRYIIKAEKQE